MVERFFSFLKTFRFPAFATEAEESEFWAQCDARRLEFRKFFLLVALLTFASMGVLDSIIGAGAAPILLAIRATAFLFMALVFYQFCQTRTPLSRELHVSAFGIIAVTAFVVMSLVGPNGVSASYPFLIAASMIFGSCLLVPRFSIQAGFCGVTNAIYWPSTAFVEIAASEFYVILFVMLITSVSVVVGARVREQLEREQALDQINLAKARDDALRANQAKSHLLANVSHELRTPLNAIIGFSELMSTEIFGQIEQDQYREYVRDIHFSGKLLHSNINDLLDISRLEVGKMQWREETFSLTETIRKVIATCDSSGKPVNLRARGHVVDNNVLMRGDVDRMSQVLINVITNAMKFSESGTAVTIGGAPDDLGNYRLHVMDEGCGISAADLKRIREPFRQVHEDAYIASDDGLGLGLAIVSGIIALSGGSFEIESELGVGTTVSLLLPIERVTVSKHPLHSALTSDSACPALIAKSA